MVGATFNPPVAPSGGSSFTNSIRVIKNDFGDGYQQRIKDGINVHEQQITVNWDAVTYVNANTIEAFFLEQEADPFYYTWPNTQNPMYVRCTEWERTDTDVFSVSITATFEKVYL